ncbi:hypothetical protein [Paenibacillus sp. UMB4589-SE434]|uniref:hypothetical protein n=1 Tax=Paenibacillus sp. UMB4589-SE434 TaxID=3046314 RepID=UPI0025508BC9|nr:hypothetical protein [Paenibacillus sp. UMB4589-SE434]MDK8179752.1 hypothetical protein [Paenibacillus sp. UMB4589-SE434]
MNMHWDQIMIQYALILRTQQIMFVKDRDESTTIIGIIGINEPNHRIICIGYSIFFSGSVDYTVGEVRSWIKG